MERSGNIQFYRPLCSLAFQYLARPVDRFRVPGDHNLRRRINIRRAANLTLSRLGTPFLDTFRHPNRGSPPSRRRQPEQLPAYTSRVSCTVLYRVGEIEHAGCNQAQNIRQGCGLRQIPASQTLQPPSRGTQRSTSSGSRAECSPSAADHPRLLRNTFPKAKNRVPRQPASNTSRAAAKLSKRSFPIPTACEPWPGKMYADLRHRKCGSPRVSKGEMLKLECYALANARASAFCNI